MILKTKIRFFGPQADHSQIGMSSKKPKAPPFSSEGSSVVVVGDLVPTAGASVRRGPTVLVVVVVIARCHVTLGGLGRRLIGMPHVDSMKCASWSTAERENTSCVTTCMFFSCGIHRR